MTEGVEGDGVLSRRRGLSGGHALEDRERRLHLADDTGRRRHPSGSRRSASGSDRTSASTAREAHFFITRWARDGSLRETFARARPGIQKHLDRFQRHRLALPLCNRAQNPPEVGRKRQDVEVVVAVEGQHVMLSARDIVERRAGVERGRERQRLATQSHHPRALVDGKDVVTDGRRRRGPVPVAQSVDRELEHERDFEATVVAAMVSRKTRQ
jgi:hypothetical protein